jgi:hypothetical protein
MLNPPIAIRIGYHKCGTTFVQDAFFRRHPDLVHLGKPWLDELIDDAHPLREMLSRIENFESYDRERCRTLFDNWLAPRLGGKLVTLSDGLLARYRGPECEQTAARLREVVGPAKIVLTVRDQVSYLKSLHGQYLSKQRTRLAIDDWLEANWSSGILVGELIRYDRVAQRFVDAFGAENVFVHLAEEMRAQPARFLANISRFLGLDPARAPSLAGRAEQNQRVPSIKVKLLAYPALYRGLVRLKRALPQGVQRRILAAARARPYEPKIGPKWIERIRETAQEVNASLAVRFGMPVAEYGYALPDAVKTPTGPAKVARAGGPLAVGNGPAE